MIRSPAGVPLAGSLALVLLLVGCSQAGAGAKPAGQPQAMATTVPTGVQVATVKRGGLASVLSCSVKAGATPEQIAQVEAAVRAADEQLKLARRPATEEDLAQDAVRVAEAQLALVKAAGDVAGPGRGAGGGGPGAGGGRPGEAPARRGDGQGALRRNRLAAAGRRGRDGMFAQVRLSIDGPQQSGLLVPRGAIVRKGGDSVAYVVADGERVEVLQGLAEGEQVATSGLSSLRDGAQVVAQ